MTAACEAIAQSLHGAAGGNGRVVQVFTDAYAALTGFDLGHSGPGLLVT